MNAAEKANLEKALDFTLRWEGGLSNVRGDYGGKTMRGITWKTLAEANKYGVCDKTDVADLTRDDCIHIYERMFWLPCHADVMADPLCVVHFDTAVLRGGGNAAKTLQYTLNGLFHVGLVVDGGIGPMTVKALNTYWPSNAKAICTRYLAQREASHRLRAAADPSQQKFLSGWLNRVNALRKYVSEVLG